MFVQSVCMYIFVIPQNKKRRTVKGDVAAMIRAARAAAAARGGGHVYVDGGTLCRAVLDAGLVVCMSNVSDT